MYDVKFSVSQVMESGVSMSLSAEVYVVTDFTAIATAIAESTDIVSASGQYHSEKKHYFIIYKLLILNGGTLHNRDVNFQKPIFKGIMTIFLT